MSDTSQGPGWWIASDGRWYPPEKHPDAAGATEAARADGTAGPAPTAAAAPVAVETVREAAPDDRGPGPDPHTDGQDAAEPGGPSDGQPGSPDEVADPEVTEAGLPVDEPSGGSAADGDSGGWVTVDVPGVKRGPAHARGRAATAEVAEADEGIEAAIRGLLVLLAVAVVVALIVLVVGNSSNPSPPTATASTSTGSRSTSVPPTTEATRLPTNPDQVVTAAVAAADREGSVHVDARLTLSGQPIQFNLDVGRIGATGTVIQNGSAIRVIITGATVYVQGTSQFLIGIGLTAAQATRYAGVWLAAPASTKGLTQVGAFNFPTLVDSLIDVAPPRSLSYPNGSGSSVTLVHGSLPPTVLTIGNGSGDPATLTVASTAPFLATRTTSSDPVSGIATYTYSLWGENVVLLAPAGAVPLAQAEGR